MRERVRRWLEEAEATERDIFDIVVATTEAFANAVEHPQEPRTRLVDLNGAIADHTITISIRDYGTWESEQKRKEEGGMGLMMIEELMEAVRVDCCEDGTTVTMRRRLATR